MNHEPPTPTRTLDLTGLPESVVRQVTQLVEQAREESPGPATPPPGLPLPLDEWLKEFEACKQEALSRADRYPPGFVLDDNLDTMYADRDRV